MYSKYFFIRVLQLFVCSFLVVVVAVVGNGPVYGAPNLEKKPIIKSSKQSYGRVSSYSDLLKTTLRAQQNAQKNPKCRFASQIPTHAIF